MTDSQRRINLHARCRPRQTSWLGALLIALTMVTGSCGGQSDQPESVAPNGAETITDASSIGGSSVASVAATDTSGAVAPPTPTEPTIDSLQFYSRFGVMASPSASLLEGYDDLETLTRSVDVVVVARIEKIGEPLVVSPDGDTIYIARILLDVEEVLSGVRVDARPDGLLVLEELTGTKDVTDELARILPAGRAIYFLRSSAHFLTGEEQIKQLDFYVVPIPAAIMTEVAGRVEVPRAAGYSPIGDATRSTNFEDLLDEIRAFGKLEPIPVDLYQTGNFRTVYDLVGLREPG